ncbi:putative LysM peptidoglycan-binding domain-containing protein [Candidatus Magnetomoraceae bacterium gMMP-15]
MLFRIGFIFLIVLALSFPKYILYAQESGSEHLKVRYGVNYTVRKGDTLWDLTTRFYDSPWSWPSLWKKNENLTNPHWIYPGQRIYIDVSQALEYARPYPIEALKEDNIVKIKEVPRIEIPEDCYYCYPSINQIGFIKKEPVFSAGIVVFEKRHKNLMSWNNKIFIKPSGEIRVKRGDLFTIIRPIEKVKYHTKYIGIHYLVVGTLAITDVGSKLARSKIIESFQSIHKSDKLIPYKNKHPNIRLIKDVPLIRSYIVASEMKKSFVGMGDIVHISKGRNEGIREGQIYSIYKDEEIKKYQDPSIARPSGKLLVLCTENHASAALITKSSYELFLNSTLSAY